MDRTYTAIAAANGTAVATVDGPNPGLLWVVPMFSVEVSPFRVGSTMIVRRGGRFVTSTSLGSGDTAYGPPSLILLPGVIMTFTWTGLTAGDQAIATLYYSEQDWSATPNGDVVV